MWKFKHFHLLKYYKNETSRYQNAHAVNVFSHTFSDLPPHFMILMTPMDISLIFNYRKYVCAAPFRNHILIKVYEKSLEYDIIYCNPIYGDPYL